MKQQKQTIKQDKGQIFSAKQIMDFNYEQYLLEKDIIDAEANGRSYNFKNTEHSDKENKIYNLISSILQIQARFDEPAGP